MQFREWLLLNENPHLRIKRIEKAQPLEDEGFDIFMVDLRVEDWKFPEDVFIPSIKTNLSNIQVRMQMHHPTPPPYYGFVPEAGQYLVYDGDKEDYRLSLQDQKPSEGIDLDELPIPRPKSWWHYVQVIAKNGKEIKSPSSPPEASPVQFRVA